MFPHKTVVYETWSCTCSHTKRLVSAHLLTYENVSMCNISHITPCVSPLTYLERCTITRL